MSNKTPKRPEEKTESAPRLTKDRSYAHLLFGAVMLFLGGWLLWSGIARLTDNQQMLIAPNGRINVEIAEDADERYKGLSDRKTISGGMLFVYDTSSIEHCLVMRDMRFSIDMVWMDADKKVVSVQSNVSPETYPEVFCPESIARYALELPAGEAEKLKITVGERLVF